MEVVGRFGSRGDSTREKRPRRGRLGPRAARPVGRLGPGRPGGGDATRLVGRLGQGRRIGAGGDLTRGVIRPGRGGGARPGDVLFFAAAGFKLVCPLAACLPHSKQRRQSGDLRGHAGRRPPAMALATWVDTRYPAVAFLLPSALFFLRLNRGGSQAQARADCANRCSQATPHPGITGALCRFKSGRRKRPSAFDAVWPSATTSCLGWCKSMPGSTRPLQPLPESRPLRVPRAL